MSEWFKELVLKTSDSQEPWVRIPLSPPPFSPTTESLAERSTCRSTQVAIRGSPAKGVDRETGARVRIPPSAPKGKTQQSQWLLGFSYSPKGFLRSLYLFSILFICIVFALLVVSLATKWPRKQGGHVFIFQGDPSVGRPLFYPVFRRGKFLRQKSH